MRDLAMGVLVAVTMLATVPAFDPVFTTTAWRGPALVAGAAGVVLAMLLHAARRGVLLSAAASTVALAASLPWLLGAATRPVLPSPDVLRVLSRLLDQGLEELAVTPAPAEPTAALLFVVVLGWWAVGHVATEAVVRIRRPGAGLIAISVLWAAPLIVPLGPNRAWASTVPFLAAAAVVLLASRGDVEDRVDTPRFPATGVALATCAIVVAATVPGILPGYGAEALVGLGTGGQPRGYQPIVDVSQRLQLPDERDLLRVRTSQRSYLRLAGLDTFDGATWRLGPPGGGSYRPDPENLYAATDVLPPESAAASTEVVYADIEVLDLENIYVPVPYQPVEVLGAQRSRMVWSTDGGFLATWETDEDEGTAQPQVGLREGMEYRVQAARPTPTFDELTDVSFDPDTLPRYTQLPRDYPDLAELARDIYADADATTGVERALALQDWFTDGGDFTYDLDVPALRGDGALRDFVLENRVGYCEYFATAMAVMLRATGIPARVALGFLPGRVTDADPGDDLTEYTVSTSDAHAWVEVLFPGYGWVTFEPTPRSDATQIAPTEQDLAPIENVRERRARELLEDADELADEAAADDPGEVDSQDTTPDDAAEGADATGATGGAGQDATRVTGPALATVLVLGAGLLWLRRRRAHTEDDSAAPAPAERVLAAQRRLLATAAAHGVGRARHETIGETLVRWRDEGRVAPIDDRFVAAVQAAAFGGEVNEVDAAHVEEMVDALVGQLRGSVGARERAIAPVRVPMTTAARTLQRTGAAVLERVERTTGGWR